MAARKRDYKAEYRRRIQLAKERGFRNYYDQRRKIETGKIPAINPKRIRSERTRQAQRKRERAEREAERGRRLYAEEQAKITEENAAADWSAAFARSDVAKYRPDEAASMNMTRAEYTRAYLAAWVRGNQYYRKVRYKGGSPALRYYLVNMMHYFSINEYEARYGPAQ